MRQTPISNQFLRRWERIGNIGKSLEQLQVAAADEGCRKLRRLIEEASSEATKKSLAVQSENLHLDKIRELINIDSCE